jgi:hypothetical protein
VDEESLLICEPFDAEVLGEISHKKMETFTKNLSEGGVLFESAETFAIGDLLKIHVDIPHWEKYCLEPPKGDHMSRQNALFALGKVVRLEDVGRGFFDIGVAFVAVDPAHKIALRKYLHSQLLKRS